MAKKRTNGDYYDTLRARFAGDADARGDARFRPPTDPTDQFFGAEQALDEAQAPRLFDPAEVRTLADGLSKRITAHGEAETRLFGYGVRFIIAAFWLTIAGWYTLAAANGDATALAKLFFIIAGAGAAAAIFGALATLATGKASLRRTKEEGVVLGQRIALETRSLEHAIGRRVDAVSADAFLKSVSFADDGDAAAERFSEYLRRNAATPSANNGARLFLIALAATIAIAAAFGLGADASVLPLADYPLALTAIVFGAGLYAGAGLLVQLFSGRWRAGREQRAEAAAFGAVRSAFAATHGFAPADLTARLRSSYGAGNMANRSLDVNREYESAPPPDSPNRARDSAPTFVETGFQAAPAPFRTDAFEKKFRS